MDDSGQRENGRHKQDQYKSLHTQWMIPPHLMKDHHAMTMKFMSILAERDAAIQERNLAVSEKKAALVERDMAIMQREAAIAERNNALMERDNAIAALEYRDSATVNGSTASTCPPGCGIPRGTKHMHHHHHVHHPSTINEAPYNSRDINISDAFPISAAASEAVKPRRAKRTKDAKALQSKKAFKPSKKGKRSSDDTTRQVPFAKPLEWKSEQCMEGSEEDMNKQLAVSKPDWIGQDLGLNQVPFDDSAMPVPGCSCTGVLQQCYKWGKGGWQSACCTTTLSMYPLPVMPNKRHARLGGRKMSGSAFSKLLSRLASEGHDLSTPLDLKDHWARHGTNRYITIK
ncbi:Gaga-binding transcriptional activator [Thalictrum thalictroides]|uniref:GAGA-binding transcriptional activator n=1 Tax=Thalictrum thalictroides TaxID=46969 RepID=A0A7J6UV05_THATH|nr:Gaga-binding transcriptional activator [Thalictrum thalictroides]